MPDAATLSSSEAVRDRDPEPSKVEEAPSSAGTPTPDVETPTPARTPYGEVSERLKDVLQEYRDVRGRRSQGMRDYAREVAPELAIARRSVTQAAEERRIARAQSQAPTLAAPPSRKLSDFLAPHEGEAPEVSVQKMMQALGIFAMGLGRGGKHDAVGALSAWTGALKGWHEGDRERADRSFKDWEANTHKALKQWEIQRKSAADIIEDAQLNMEDKFRLLNLLKHQHEIKDMPEAHDEETLKQVLGSLEKQQSNAATLERTMMTVAQRKAQADQLHLDKIRAIDAKFELAEMKLKQEQVSPFTDQEVDTMARLYIANKQQPSFGMGASARPDRARFWLRVSQIAPEYGGVEGIVAKQNALIGLRGEGAAVMKTRGLVEAFSQTAAKNLRDAEALSQQVDRTGSPMLNKWLLAGRKAWSGDPGVAEFDAAVRTAIAETARVLNSANATGVLSDTARREIEEMLNTALTKEQFLRVVNRLHKEMENRRTSYTDQVQAIQEETKRAAGPTPTTMPGAGGKVKLSRQQFDAAKARGYSEQQIREKYDVE